MPDATDPGARADCALMPRRSVEQNRFKNKTLRADGALTENLAASV